MAKAMIEIGFNEEANRLLRALADSAPTVEPWVVQTASGPHGVWVDSANQEHFVAPARESEAVAAGWRRLYTGQVQA